MEWRDAGAGKGSSAALRAAQRAVSRIKQWSSVLLLTCHRDALPGGYDRGCDTLVTALGIARRKAWGLTLSAWI